jgi:UDP-galactopyranose mutase
MTQFGDFDLIVVGSGLFGITVAERCAHELGLRVLVVERRNHVGGNAWSSVDEQTGIEVHDYGSHIFHCTSQDVWTYVNRFTAFSNYRHRVVTRHQNRFYTMPMNLGTLSSLYGRFLSPDDARALVSEEVRASGISDPKNLEEKAISLVGRRMYDAFIRGYTAKQWQTDPKDLPADIITRLPVRYTFDDAYFSDPYQGIPLVGYGALIRRMLDAPGIEAVTSVDYFDIRSRIPAETPVVYTGPIDRYFHNCAGELGWRTLDFEREVLATADYQGTSVVNYPDSDVQFTRIHEFRHLHPERKYGTDQTVIFKEYSRFSQRTDEPYYPIDTRNDKSAYQAYRDLADKEPNVIFGGRLGTYRYLDMHQAIGAALKVFDNILQPHFVDGRPLKHGRHAHT